MTRNLVLRFAPVGRKHLKKYRIVVAQKFRSVNKLYIEVIGSYDPVSKAFTIKEDRLKHYLDLNLEISQSLQSLLKKQNYLQVDKK
jgi:ribosomal protein S16